MPTEQALRRAKQDKREGKSPSTQAGEFIRGQIDEIRRGEHGARSTKQAIAIGLSQARRAGVELPAPQKGKVSEKTRRNAQLAYDAGHGRMHGTPSPRRAAATSRALKREGTAAASPVRRFRNTPIRRP